MCRVYTLSETRTVVRLGIVSTHPIQYQVPWIRGLAAWSGIEVHAYYGLLPDEAQQGVGFGAAFRWDVPLLDGYAWTAVPNRARRPSLASWWGIHAPGLGAALESFAPDVVVICGWHSRFLVEAERACRRRGIPALVRGESNALRRRAWWKRAIHRRYLKHFAGALAIGRSNAQFLREAGVPEERIHWAPYAVEETHLTGPLAGLREQRSALRRRFGVPDGAACFLFVGKLQPKKRLLDLLAAIGRLHGRRLDVHALIVGTGEEEPRARALVERERLPATFAGFLNQTEIAGAYVAADALVLPSDEGETWGLVVNEAMICGLPVVVSDRVGCGPDLVRDGETGFRYPCGDVEALAGVLAVLAEDPEGRVRRGQLAQRLVAHYSIARAVEGTARAAESVARCRRGEGPA
jgi:glycosyltransferase involved in cell wall biosynthesis